ncbi:MAG: hypothetical protein ACOYEF_02700 [Planifilum sp.]|jgi:hypothetical protein
MSSDRWTAEECDWLSANYGSSDIHEITHLLNGRFGTHRSEHAVYTKANVLGLHRPRMGGRRRAEWGVVCSKCNAHIEQAVKRRFRFCPNCGAKAVDE